MDALTFVLFILGLGLLVGGAELLVRGASRLALGVGVSPLVIGLTVVAYGTSFPEFSVSLLSALDDKPDLALGNVVGSNIFNILLILGISACITPLTISYQIIRLDAPIMIGTALVVLLMGWSGIISPLEGLVLVSGAFLYTWFVIRQSRREVKAQAAENETPPVQLGFKSVLLNLLLIVLGLGLLVLGSRWLIDGAVIIARLAGLSELVIGLTIVAGGTSLPEVAASVVAALRGERDIAVGNVVGSNIFNILFVLGASSAVSGGGVAVSLEALQFDIPVMIAVSVLCLPLFYTGFELSRWEGGLFLLYYILYTVFLVLKSSASESLEMYRMIVIYIVIPLSLLTVVGSVIYSRWHHKKESAS